MKVATPTQFTNSMRAGVSKRRARILVVDDHPVVRGGLIRLIDRQADLICCGEATSAAEAESAVKRSRPDLVIVDLRLKGSDGLDLIRSLRSRFSSVRTLVLSQYDAPLYAERSMRAGALGYVAKDQPVEDLLQAMRCVLKGEIYLAPGVAARMVNTFMQGERSGLRAGIDQLTNRELHVLQLLGEGMSTRAIASELQLSFKTIQTHRENIKHKLGLEGAAELLHFANDWARRHATRG